MMKRVRYFFSSFSMSPGIVLMSTGCLVVKRVEVLFGLGSYLLIRGASDRRIRLYYSTLGDAKLDVELSCWC
jgi:hypothetical protein